MSNPLLEDHTLPPFSKINAEHVVPAIEQLMKDNLNAIEALLDSGANSWESLIEPLDLLDDKLNKAWSPVSHMNSVVNTPELREAYNACLPKLADYGSKIGQNKRLYEAYLTLSKSEAFQSYDAGQKKVIENALRDFKLAGVALNDSDRERFSRLKQDLSKVQSGFSDNVLDATDAWHLLVEDSAKLSGLPEMVQKAAQDKAKEHEQRGYRFGLDFPTYHAVLTYADDESLRQQMHEAFATRASDQGPFAGQYDNSSLIEDILSMRHNLSQILGFDNYAQYSLATKMAKDPNEVLHFLEDLAKKAKQAAVKDYEELQQFAKENGHANLRAHDVAYFSEKLRKQKFDVSQEELRPYFPHQKVMQGMFAVIEKLYGMRVETKTDVDTWHEQVDFVEVYDHQNKLRGQFYFDLFARAQKRGGAWMDECRVRSQTKGKLQVPVAYLTCNFTPPEAGKNSLLTHDEVVTLFHEFGHGLHHVLTQVDYPPVSGINGVPWDAVELPSQFMENWCWEEEALLLISGHHQSQEPLPKALLDKLKRAKNFQAGLGMIRQLEFGLFDFRLHASYQPNETQFLQVLEQVRKDYSVIPVPAYNRFTHSFNHIFSGGYAAGYYSYLWAELLSCDAFSRFKEEGIFNAQTGKRFLECILEKGGSEDPSRLFEAFRGRSPSIEPLLESHGLSV